MGVTGNRHRGDGSGEFGDNDLNDAQQIVSAYSDMVYRFAYAMMRNRSDADDIYQEVFLRYIRRRPIFQSPQHARAWMLRVTANCCKNHWRSPWADGRMEPLEGHEEGSVPGGDPARQAQENWERERLRGRVGELPENYRLLIHLYYYEGLSTEEIARLLHRRAATVRTQLVRARQRLREILEREVEL